MKNTYSLTGSSQSRIQMGRLCRILGVLALGTLSGCGTLPLKPQAASLRITFDPAEVRQCRYLGEIAASEGRFYNFFFLADDVWISRAINELRNRSYDMGADTVLMPTQSFWAGTSASILGQCYQCSDEKRNSK